MSLQFKFGQSLYLSDLSNNKETNGPCVRVASRSNTRTHNDDATRTQEHTRTLSGGIKSHQNKIKTGKVGTPTFRF